VEAKELWNLPISERSITSAGFTGEGRAAVLGDSGGTIRLCKLPPIAPIAPRSSPPVERLSLGGATEQFRLTAHVGAVWDAWPSDDGKLIVTGGDDGVIQIWDIKTRTLAKTIRGHRDRAQYTRFSPDNKLVLCGSADGTSRLWDVAAGKAIFEWKTRAFAPVAFSRDGARLTVGGSEGDTVRVYETRTGVLLREFSIPTDDVGTRQLAFLPGGNAIALAGYRGTLRVMDVETGAKLADCVGHLGEVTCVDVSEDGATMISGGLDSTLRLWDVGTGREILSIRTGDSPIWRVRYPASDRALTWGNDHHMRCFDLETRQERWRIPTPGMWIGEFSKDGKLALLGEIVGGLRVWTLPPLR